MKHNPFWSKFEWWFLLGIILLAFGVRVFRIYPLMTFTYDQGRDMYALQKIVRGDITLIGPTTGLPGVFLGPYMYYLLIPGFVLSNGSPFGVVIWQMTLIVLTFPFFYWLLKPLTGRWWAGLAIFWLALAPGAIEQARAIWNPSLVVMTLLPSLYCLFASRQKKWLLPLSFFFFGLSLQTELAYTFFLGPLYGLWLLTYLELPKSILQRLPAWLRPLKAIYDWRVVMLAMVAFGLTLIPQALFELKNNFLITNSVIREMGDASKQVSYQKVWAERPAIIWSELKNTLSGGAPGASLVASLSLVAGIYALVRYRKHPAALFLAGYMLLPLGAFMFHRGNYGYFFDYYITAHYLPAIAVIILALADITKSRPQIGRGVGVSLFFVILFIFGWYGRVIFNVPLFQYTAARQIQALQYAREVSQTEKPALEVFVPNLLPIAYQYLSEWLSRTGQATPIDFGGSNHEEYILIYEPAIGEGSRFAKEEWYRGWKLGAECEQPVTFGITIVERCFRPL